MCSVNSPWSRTAPGQETANVIAQIATTDTQYLLFIIFPFVRQLIL